ncbi:radical SAM protein [Candidatus Woesearchaeota archaeon]|nr:radical SAM protein [Candidatus Woesearchaeota archaeon]
MRITKTPYYSWRAGELTDGCKYCVEGEKLVLFVTGLCPARCDFCPVSDRKLYKDVIYANERQLENEKDAKAIIEEAKACSAKGAGITGGDPLVKLDRAINYIKLLKKNFGRKFHIHLYTPLVLVNEKNLFRLCEAGLDEIRFHPKLDKPEDWSRIMLAKNKKLKGKWNVGVEIPVIPGKEAETKLLIDFIADKVDFLNLNELELADNAVWRNKKNIKCKDNLSYAIKGSDELAKKLLRYAVNQGIRTHYCTCKLKDKVQLTKRIIRRAENVKQKFDVVAEDGMLTRGAFYLPEMKPGFGYHEKLNSLEISEKKKILNKLESIRKEILKEEELPEHMLLIDEHKLRLITSPWLARIINSKGLVKAVITEYPTFDALEIEVDVIE